MDYSNNLKSAIGHQVSFICDRGLQITGKLEELYPKETDDEYISNYDYCLISGVKILGPGGTVYEEHPDKFTLILKPIMNVVGLEDIKKNASGPVKKLATAGKDEPEISIIAKYLYADEQSMQVEENKDAEAMIGWNSNLKAAKKICDEAMCNILDLLPTTKEIDQYTDNGAYHILFGIKHTLNDMISQSGEELAKYLAPLAQIISVKINRARLNYNQLPF